MKILVSFLFACLIATSGLGQTASLRTNEALFEIRNAITKNPVLGAPNLRGSPYYVKKFFPAEVQYFDLEILGEVFLRYNAFSDEIEIGQHINQEDSEEIILKHPEIICSFGGKTYYYTLFKNRQDHGQMGYLIKIHQGKNYVLFLQQKKNYREATVARTSLERSFPPRFMDEQNYYFRMHNKTPFFLGKDLKEVRKNLPAEVKEAARRAQLNVRKLKNETDLIRLIKKIDS